MLQIDVYNINNRQRDREIVRQTGEGSRYRQMYTIQNNRYREIVRYLDRQEEEVATDRCIQFRKIERERQRDSKIDRRRRQLQIDVYNIEQQIERQRDSQIDRRRRQLQKDVHNLEQQIERDKERQLDRQEEEVGTERCIQHN